MLIQDENVLKILRAILRGLTADVTLREDLMQEALIRLWILEQRRPGQTKSWYLQNCRFHLQHYLAAGKSVDARKRRNGKTLFGCEEEMNHCDCPSLSADVFGDSSAREIVGVLSGHLKLRERAVLDCLADGLGAREIARKLNVSHPTAIKDRRKIASLAIKFGIMPPPSFPRNVRTNGAVIHAGNSHNGLAAVNGHKPLNGATQLDHRKLRKDVSQLNGHKPANGSASVNGHKALNGSASVNGHKPSSASVNGHDHPAPVNGHKMLNGSTPVDGQKLLNGSAHLKAKKSCNGANGLESHKPCNGLAPANGRKYFDLSTPTERRDPLDGIKFLAENGITEGDPEDAAMACAEI